MPNGSERETGITGEHIHPGAETGQEKEIKRNIIIPKNSRAYIMLSFYARYEPEVYGAGFTSIDEYIQDLKNRYEQGDKAIAEYFVAVGGSEKDALEPLLPSEAEEFLNEQAKTTPAVKEKLDDFKKYVFEDLVPLERPEKLVIPRRSHLAIALSMDPFMGPGDVFKSEEAKEVGYRNTDEYLQYCLKKIQEKDQDFIDTLPENCQTPEDALREASESEIKHFIQEKKEYALSKNSGPHIIGLYDAYEKYLLEENPPAAAPAEPESATPELVANNPTPVEFVQPSEKISEPVAAPPDVPAAESVETSASPAERVQDFHIVRGDDPNMIVGEYYVPKKKGLEGEIHRRRMEVDLPPELVGASPADIEVFANALKRFIIENRGSKTPIYRFNEATDSLELKKWSAQKKSSLETVLSYTIEELKKIRGQNAEAVAELERYKKNKKKPFSQLQEKEQKEVRDYEATLGNFYIPGEYSMVKYHFINTAVRKLWEQEIGPKKLAELRKNAPPETVTGNAGAEPAKRTTVEENTPRLVAAAEGKEAKVTPENFYISEVGTFEVGGKEVRRRVLAADLPNPNRGGELERFSIVLPEFVDVSKSSALYETFFNFIQERQYQKTVFYDADDAKHFDQYWRDRQLPKELDRLQARQHFLNHARLIMSQNLPLFKDPVKNSDAIWEVFNIIEDKAKEAGFDKREAIKNLGYDMLTGLPKRPNDPDYFLNQFHESYEADFENLAKGKAEDIAAEGVPEEANKREKLFVAFGKMLYEATSRRSREQEQRTNTNTVQAVEQAAAQPVEQNTPAAAEAEKSSLPELSDADKAELERKWDARKLRMKKFYQNTSAGPDIDIDKQIDVIKFGTRQFDVFMGKKKQNP